MKLTGAVIILFGAGRIWFIAQRERRQKRVLLVRLQLMLFRMAEEIRQLRTPLPILLERFSADKIGDAGYFPCRVLTLAREGENLYSAWKTAADALPLDSSDRQIITDLAEELRGDSEHIGKALSAASDALSDRAARLTESDRTDTRQTAALIFSAALLLVILLF